MANAASTPDKKPPRTAAKSSAKPATRKAAAPKPAKSAAEPTADAAPKTGVATPADTQAPAKAPRKATATKVAKSPAAKSPIAKSPVAKPPAEPAKVPSRNSGKTSKENSEHVERVWELAKRIGTAMFVTWDGEEQRARPLAATIEKDEGVIYFLTDIHGQKDDQVAEFPHVSVSFADHKASKFVALTGTATVSNDRAKIKELWSPFAKAWWDSPEDPAIRVIKVLPRDAEFWDSPGRIVTTISMLAAAVTGRSPKIGENAKVVL